MNTTRIKTIIKQMTKWQWAFIGLLTLNFIILAGMMTLLVLSPPQSDLLPEPNYIEEPGASFTVNATKHDLNTLINDYLDQVLRSDQADFSVLIDEDFALSGTFTAFGIPVPLNVRMDPVVQANGDLVLEVNEMSLGLLNLPRDRILHYINRQVSTPDWLYFDSTNEQLYLAVTQIEIQSNFRFSVESLDLSDDDISFTFKIPEGDHDDAFNETNAN
ncbi:uncharacterized protein YpmS [Streptohalobacillus salinus]|uniref:Uncharacterized protein YpmS n=1 Tax=Streptohalobacillus salinus TaxID=621096 RepID=A0A2V3WI41_9BACI|nr:YpmS family protein [Streptohalobacillus salinus]PXW92107.1 uncharacterized protein YpmS [Streptohalobacillus salinus]